MSARARVLAGQTSADGTARHTTLEAFAVLLEAQRLPAPAPVLVGDAGDGGKRAGHHRGAGGAVLGVERVRIALQDYIYRCVTNRAVFRSVFTGEAPTGRAASGPGSEALAVSANTEINTRNSRKLVRLRYFIRKHEKEVLQFQTFGLSTVASVLLVVEIGV